MKKRYLDANILHITDTETGEIIQTTEHDVLEIKSARESNHSTFKKNDFKGSKFCTLNTDMFPHYLNRAKLKWTEKGFLFQK
jgi:hypothetical protein